LLDKTLVQGERSVIESKSNSQSESKTTSRARTSTKIIETKEKLLFTFSTPDPFFREQEFVDGWREFGWRVVARKEAKVREPVANLSLDSMT
jgi:hypothetical protein